MQFVLYKHSLTSVCFRKSKDAFTLRERLFILVFVLMQTMSVATQADMWIHEDGGERTWKTQAATLCLTIFVVTPITLLVKLLLTPISQCLNERIWCVKAWLCGLRVEEVFVAAQLGRMVYWAYSTTEAHEARAAIFGLVAVGAQLAAEVPILIFQFSCCYACCQCCLPKDDDFGMMDRL